MKIALKLEKKCLSKIRKFKMACNSGITSVSYYLKIFKLCTTCLLPEIVYKADSLRPKSESPGEQQSNIKHFQNVSYCYMG